MKKVVVNRCHGGFGLSNEAIKLLLTKLGIEFEIQSSKYNNDEFEYYHKGNLGDDKFLIHEEYQYIARDNEYLIEIVETLGEKANGCCAQLRVIEIPDDIEWQIDNYDGMERISETHIVFH